MAPVLLLLLTLQGQDPVRVNARLNDQEIPAGETTVLRVEVETDGDRAQIQRFRSLPPGLELQGTRDFDQRQFSIPGGTRRFISREFVLRARAPGRYRIPTIDVVVAGQTYSTRSLLLTVTAAPARGRDLEPDGNHGVVLRAWLDADTVFVGEQVTMEAEALFSQEARLRLRRAPEYEPPTPAGFWVHELPDPGRGTTRADDGGLYEVQRFRRAFFPMAPGEYEIPPARLEYEARRGLLYAPETRELTTDPIPLVVLEVPGSRPASFTGAVGSYTARGWLEPARLPAGEATVLTVEVEGVGNVKALPPPALPDLDGIEVFPPSEDADTEVRDGRIRGSKRFSWVLIPRQAGSLEVPEIRYTFFDPTRGDFGTVSVEPMTLDVTPGTGAAEMQPTPTLRYLETDPRGSDPLGWVRSSWFAATQALPFLLIAAAVAWNRRGRRRDRPLSRRALRKQLATWIQELEERGPEADATIFAEAEAFARRWLADRLGIPSSDAHRVSRLTAAGVGQDTASAVHALLERVAAARYTPRPPVEEARRDMIRALGRMLDRVDREAPAPARNRYAAEKAASVALLCLFLAPPFASHLLGEQAVDEESRTERVSPAAWFREGVRTFDEERYAEAAEAFRRYTRVHPTDAAGWYNLGTAYYQAGHPGHAVRAWLKVLPLDPRNADVRHNLSVVGVRPELVDRAAPPLAMRSSELLFLASVAWLVFGVAAAVWLVRRATWSAAIAGVSLVLALGFAGAGWATTSRPQTLIVLEPYVLRAGPTLRADPVVELEPGTGLEPVEARGDWLRARTLRGDEGWIESTATGRL